MNYLGSPARNEVCSGSERKQRVLECGLFVRLPFPPVLASGGRGQRTRPPGEPGPGTRSLEATREPQGHVPGWAAVSVWGKRFAFPAWPRPCEACSLAISRVPAGQELLPLPPGPKSVGGKARSVGQGGGRGQTWGKCGLGDNL